MPAKAGIHVAVCWVPAFAGTSGAQPVARMSGSEAPSSRLGDAVPDFASLIRATAHNLARCACSFSAAMD
jgi:hypothetical protein